MEFEFPISFSDYQVFAAQFPLYSVFFVVKRFSVVFVAGVFELYRVFQLLIDKPILIEDNFCLKKISISAFSCRFVVVVL